MILRILFYADEGDKKHVLVPGVVNSGVNSLLNYRTYCIRKFFYVAFNLTMSGNHKITCRLVSKHVTNNQFNKSFREIFNIYDSLASWP